MCGNGIRWTPGRYDTVVIPKPDGFLSSTFHLMKVSDLDAPDEMAAMNMVLKRADRMDTGMLVAVPMEAPGPVSIS
jgi:hypothetical protein